MQLTWCPRVVCEVGPGGEIISFARQDNDGRGCVFAFPFEDLSQLLSTSKTIIY